MRDIRKLKGNDKLTPAECKKLDRILDLWLADCWRRAWQVALGKKVTSR
jgi:hypothetical protein